MQYVVGIWVDDICFYVSSYSVSVSGKGNTLVSNVNQAVVFDKVHYARAIAELFSMDVYVYSVNEGEN
jgi:hypothetical protein